MTGSPGGNGVGDTVVAGQRDYAGTVSVHDEDVLVPAVPGAMKRNLLAVGRPDGVVVDEITRRELADSGPVRVHHEDMEVAVGAVAAEHNPPPVRRPAGVVALIVAGIVGESDDPAPVRVHGVELEGAIARADEHDLL